MGVGEGVDGWGRGWVRVGVETKLTINVVKHDQNARLSFDRQHKTHGLV